MNISKCNPSEEFERWNSLLKTPKKNIIDYIKTLPPHLGCEIFSFLVLNGNLITFAKGSSFADNTNYSPRYEIGFISGRYFNNNNYFLSRIYKKNLKHRYYITTITCNAYCDECGKSNCNSYYCGRLTDEVYYSSKYICSNLDEAVLKFYIMSNSKKQDHVTLQNKYFIYYF